MPHKEFVFFDEATDFVAPSREAMQKRYAEFLKVFDVSTKWVTDAKTGVAHSLSYVRPKAVA